MKFINTRKLVAIVLTGFVLTTTGCQKKSDDKSIVFKENENPVIEIYEEEENVILLEESNEKIIEMENYEIPLNQQDKEIYIKNYFYKANEMIDSFLQSESVSNAKSKSKEIFVTLVDFMFYDGEISGITYDELSEETKNEINKIIVSIDEKIENKIPGYKETIIDKTGKSIIYLNDKFQIIKTKLENKIIDKITEEEYNNIKNEVKEKTTEIKDTSKELYEKGKEKVKNWYEGWK